MALSAPTKLVWIVSLILGVLGLLGKFAVIPVITVNAFWLLAAGFVVLVISTICRGL